MKKGKGSPKGSKNPKVPTTIDLEDLDPSQLLAPTIEVPGLKREAVNTEVEDSSLVKLLLAINMRALDIPSRKPMPKMDLTALYCLGTAIQEYTRYLSTNVMTQKLASENLPQLNTHFTPEEIKSRRIAAIIDEYKVKKPVKLQKPLSSEVIIRPNLHQETTSKARSIKYHQNNPFHVDTTSEDTYYQKLLRAPDWEHQLRKKKDPEAAAAAAKIRREKDQERSKQIKLIKQEEQKIHIPPPIKQEYLPVTPPADIFDTELKSKQKKSKKRSISSSSSSSSKKRKKGFA